MKISVCALYNFTPIADPQALQATLFSLCEQHGIHGTLLVGTEGVNGTVAGPQEGLDELVALLRSLDGFDQAEIKFSEAESMPFRRLKVKIKNEIVTMGVDGIDPLKGKGKYVTPEEWNDLITRDDVVLIDTRNDYEFEIGHFKNSINPDIKTFREFPDWFRKNKSQWEGKKVAMFCTGGIRCEKSTAFAVEEELDEVFHLKGGILAYLENVPEDQSTWDGDCFVFDGRVALGHGLEISDHELCFACRRPITPEQMESDDYEYGVSCHWCINEISDERRERYRERQRQMILAEQRGENHMATAEEAEAIRQKRRAERAKQREEQRALNALREQELASQ